MTWPRQVDAQGSHTASPCAVAHADASSGSVRCRARVFSTSMAVLASPDLDIECYTCCHQHSACLGLMTGCRPLVLAGAHDCNVITVPSYVTIISGGHDDSCWLLGDDLSSVPDAYRLNHASTNAVNMCNEMHLWTSTVQVPLLDYKGKNDDKVEHMCMANERSMDAKVMLHVFNKVPLWSLGSTK